MAFIEPTCAGHVRGVPAGGGGILGGHMRCFLYKQVDPSFPLSTHFLFFLSLTLFLSPIPNFQVISYFSFISLSIFLIPLIVILFFFPFSLFLGPISCHFIYFLTFPICFPICLFCLLSLFSH